MYWLAAQEHTTAQAPATKMAVSFVCANMGGIILPRTKGSDDTVSRRSRTMG